MRGSPRTVLIDSLDECPIGYSSERSVDQPPTRLRIYADYKLANQNILLNNYGSLHLWQILVSQLLSSSQIWKILSEMY